MKNNYRFISICLISSILSFGVLSAQCLMRELPFDELVKQSTSIVEGRVVSSSSFWNTTYTRIFTRHQVEVYKVFKGNENLIAISVITEGGRVGLDLERVEPSLQLAQDQTGLFFLIPSKESDPIFKSSEVQFMNYGSAQGFVLYDMESGEGISPFRHYESVEMDLYPKLEAETGRKPKILKPLSFDKTSTGSSGSFKAAPSISSFSPASISAGTYSELTINGSGFGASRGTSVVKFKNADNGGSTYITPDANQYISWSDNQIKVQVPVQVSGNTGNAGTGKIQVKVGSSTGTSAASLNIPFGVFNVQFNGGIHQMDFVNLSGNGGLTLQMNTNFASNTQAVSAFMRAFKTWRCGSFVNWELGANTSVNSQSSDGTSVIRFDSGNELPAGIIGRLNSWWSGCAPAGNIWFVKDVDLVYDGSTNWNYSTANPSSSQNDFESTTLHELGHASQLTHVIKPSDAMHYLTAPGLSQRSLTPDALDGANEVISRSIIPNACGPGEMVLLTSGNCSVGIDDVNTKLETISVYPNPTTGFIFLERPASFNESTMVILKVRNILGEVMIEENKRFADNSSLNIKHLAPGVYVLDVKTNTGERFQQKIIKQ